MAALVTSGKSSSSERKNNATEEQDMSQKARQSGCVGASWPLCQGIQHKPHSLSELQLQQPET